MVSQAALLQGDGMWGYAVLGIQKFTAIGGGKNEWDNPSTAGRRNKPNRR